MIIIEVEKNTNTDLPFDSGCTHICKSTEDGFLTGVLCMNMDGDCCNFDNSSLMDKKSNGLDGIVKTAINYLWSKGINRIGYNCEIQELDDYFKKINIDYESEGGRNYFCAGDFIEASRCRHAGA
ncbi:hypothetical protein [Alkalibacter mobilis]|uniref:hypothetical protein n=1 Tax=Alkalibacter mobilis TaxID=2787712 RepID=UPI00189E0CFD|nr:hypothetical protein [Alkalibacter mobilis]MBF7097632.1 hypothetical protein [Alkalibacter mobilis]